MSILKQICRLFGKRNKPIIRKYESSPIYKCLRCQCEQYDCQHQCHVCGRGSLILSPHVKLCYSCGLICSIKSINKVCPNCLGPLTVVAQDPPKACDVTVKLDEESLRVAEKLSGAYLKKELNRWI